EFRRMSLWVARFEEPFEENFAVLGRPALANVPKLFDVMELLFLSGRAFKQANRFGNSVARPNVEQDARKFAVYFPAGCRISAVQALSDVLLCLGVQIIPRKNQLDHTKTRDARFHSAATFEIGGKKRPQIRSAIRANHWQKFLQANVVLEPFRHPFRWILVL